ncbi:MAG: purine-nucleoside phosphorylase [Nanoarchaeota archaeon]|nr:purine-nucleoside phosphorylase [Nanoarchaeota archaeon]
MPYPNFKDKHLQEALFHPRDYIKYRKLKKNLPKKYILTYQGTAKNYFIKKYKPKRIKNLELVMAYRYKNMGFIFMPGIGSPHAVTALEEMIALGGKEFINIGTAGGLHKQGVFLCIKALRDEGTSYHYLPDGKFSYPDKKLTKELERSIEKLGLKYTEGTTWTIDAPYRETKKEIEHYVKEGISTVEMETSALFTVAKYRKVKIASAFIVSDVLGEKWNPGFHKFDVKRAQNILIDAAVDCLSKK